MKPSLIITRGLPASGKSRWANEWVQEDEANRARVCRDDIRLMVCGRYWPAPEDTVTVVEKAAIRALLRAGRSVVVDATHLRAAHAKEVAKLAAGFGAEFKVMDFLTPWRVCVERDNERAARGERAVGAEIIENMARKFGLWRGDKWLAPVELPVAETLQYQYVPNDKLPCAWLFDIDGTLAHMDGRGPFDWHLVHEDALDLTVAALAADLARGTQIIYLSGRDESCRLATQRWIGQHGLPGRLGDILLYMRPEGDIRKDAVVKLELFRNYIEPNWNVLGVFDDRNQVVEMWRRVGLKCFQVAEGDF